jgi:DNA end-binding protein Ku
MVRPLWKGTISFGLVTIPVIMTPGVAPRELAFHLLDGRDQSPIHNKRVNGNGEEVPWEHVIKGHELPDGRWVALTDEDFRAANVRSTRTIDVLGAVCADDVKPEYFDAPYYLSPEPQGVKAYALLRQSLARAKRIAIGQVVIRTRQHLCALVAEGDLLLLEVLRYQHELRDPGELELPSQDLAALGVTDAELNLAEQLISTIEAKWDPSQYKDTYREDLLALIARKADGETIVVAESEPEPAAQVIDIAELLKRSVEQAREARPGA